MKTVLIFCTIVFLGNSAFSQCSYNNNTFSSGENVSYNVYYNLGFLWFNAAEVNFKVNTKKFNNREAFHFTSYGQTLPNYDWIFKVRDNFESIADIATLKPLYFSRKTNEGKYSVNNSYTFNYTDSSIYSTIENSETPLYHDTIKIQDCTFDVLTAIYACRSISYSTLNYIDTIPLNMVIDNKIYNLYLRYLGIENAKLDDSTEYRCRKFRILMVAGTIFSGDEDIVVWISDDKAKIPISVEAKILVGSIIAKVNKIEGNKWSLNSKIINKAGASSQGEN